VQKNFKLEIDFEDVNWSGLSINGTEASGPINKESDSQLMSKQVAG